MMWAFLHIPKTGGTGLEDYFQNNKCDIIGRGHFNTERTFENTSTTVFTILREPVDRFFSSFYYWKDGASSGLFRRSEFQKEEHHRLYPTIGSFIDAIINKSLIAESILSTPMGITWKDHFDPQSNWLNGKHVNTWLICYHNKFLLKNANEFLNKTTNKCVIPENTLVNPTVRYQKNRLTYLQLNWIRFRYRDDFALWKKCENNPFVRL